jgi:hypothetical protein
VGTVVEDAQAGNVDPAAVADATTKVDTAVNPPPEPPPPQ